MADITQEQWEVLRLRRSQQDLELLLRALAVDGTVTVTGNSDPPEADPEAAEDAPDPVVTTQQAEAELNALAAELEVQAAEQAEEEAAKAAKASEKKTEKVEAKA